MSRGWAFLKHVWRITKALTVDPRLPRILRWTLAVAIFVKVTPVPDFGLDEILLGILALLLLTCYRPILRAVIEETA